jgi:hypothetical protein
MSEIDEQSDDLTKKITCNSTTCEALKDNEVDYGKTWVRKPQLFGMAGDLLVNNNSKRDAFLKGRKKRNAKHFDQEVMPKLVDGSAEKKHFIKKAGFKS